MEKEDMTLREFLFYNDVTLKEMAETLEITPRYLGMISRGKKPSAKVAKHIERYTKGKVKADSLIKIKLKKTTN